MEGTTPPEVVEAAQLAAEKQVAGKLSKVGQSAMQGIGAEASAQVPAGAEVDPETKDIEGLVTEHADATTGEKQSPKAGSQGPTLSQKGISSMQGPKD